MRLEGFRLLEDTSIDTSNIKQDYMKTHHQEGTQLSSSNQGFKFIF